jgi:iron-sulfur cluster assembly protein
LLTLTNRAASAIHRLTSRFGMPADTGMRISSVAGDDPTLRLGFSEDPEPGDKIVEEYGARVFLAPDAAATLLNRVLHAQVTDDGGVSFFFEQAYNGHRQSADSP